MALITYWQRTDIDAATGQLTGSPKAAAIETIRRQTSGTRQHVIPTQCGYGHRAIRRFFPVRWVTMQ